MAANWQTAYRQLSDYIKSNPRISIEADSTLIPPDFRHEFYNRFDHVTSTFIDQFFAPELDFARELKDEFELVEAEVTPLLDAKPKIKVAASLRWLLDDPVNGMSRPLFGLVFDLVREKLDPDSFEQAGRDEVNSLFASLFRSGYEKWVILTLIKWLAPARAMTLPLHQINLYASGSEGDSQYEQTEVLPQTSKLEELTFDYSNWVSFTVPEVIVYSEKLNKYVSIKDGFAEPHWNARYVSPSKSWLPLRPVLKVLNPAGGWPNVLVLTGENINDVHLIADQKRLCRPDLAIDTMEQTNWAGRQTFKRLRDHCELIKPARLAVFSRAEIPSQARSEIVGTGEANLPETVNCYGEKVDRQPAGENAQANDTAGGDKLAISSLLRSGYDQPRLFRAFESLFSPG